VLLWRGVFFFCSAGVVGWCGDFNGWGGGGGGRGVGGRRYFLT